MRNLIRLIAVLCIATVVFTACKKNDTGGDVVVTASPSHHGTPIYGATIYVKFDATESSADITTNYDARFIGEPNETFVRIGGLRYGDYFLYAEGFDSTISAPVSGGVAVKIKWSERKDERDVEVPVTE
jgi:hypothetical protein